MNNLPMADARSAGTIEKIRALQASRKLAGAANNTKWNELITFMRGLEGWCPSYRSKWIGGFISEWDVEWFYHLPFPFAGVEWFDIGLHSSEHQGMLIPAKVIDHSPLILPVLEKIRFDFEVRGDVVRIWGYHPRSYEDFPPA